MSFLNLNLFLAGLAALSIPLLILLLQRKRILLDWGAYEWMRQAVARKRKRLRITEILKLLSKLLLIFALALLLGRAGCSSGAPPKTLLVVDNTLSMGTKIEGRTRLEKAVELAGAFVSANDGAVSLASFDGSLHRLAPFQTDKAALQRQLGAIGLAAGTGSAKELQQALLEYPDLAELERIIVFSDFQAQFWGDGNALAELRSRLGRAKSLNLAPVDSRRNLGNVGLSSLRLAPEGFYFGRENQILAEVRNYSPEPVERIAVTLSLDGADQDRALVSLGPQEAKWVSLSCQTTVAGKQELLLTLPDDDFVLDNRLYAQLRPRERYHVLAVVPPKPAGQEFELDVFLRAALLAVGGPAQWDYKRVTPQQVMPDDLGNVDLVLLPGVPLRESDSYLAPLKDYLRQGRGLIAFAGPPTPDYWAGVGLRVGEAQTTPRSADPDRLAGTYLEFMAQGDLDPRLLNFLAYAPFVQVPAPEHRLFAKGLPEPLLVAHPAERGLVIAAGFLPAPGSTDVFYNPNFVQFFQRLVWEGLRQNPLAMATGNEAAKLRLPGLSQGSRYTLALAGEPAVNLPLQLEGNDLLLRLEPPVAGGFYQIAENGQAFYRFGYNPARSDSAIEPAAARLAEEVKKVNQPRELYLFAGHDFRLAAAHREWLWLAALLFVLALALENYAHLIRKN